MPTRDFKSVNQNTRRVDSVKLASGKGTFVDDIKVDAVLYAKILHSPHAHARIKKIDVQRAEQLHGVHCVLTYRNVPRVPYTTAGQGWPEPSPYDTVMFDSVVRFVGDRVACVAADSEEIAERALDLIEVDYEVLSANFDPRKAMDPGTPRLHLEPDKRGIHSAPRNIAAHVQADVGDVEKGFAEAECIHEGEYSVHYVQQASIEPHITITWLDEDGRLMVRTSTQVPFHVRRIIAPLIGLPIQRIRVIKPRIGGGFGGKQEILIEDLCAMVTVRTGRPCRLEYTRAEELYAARTRHPQIVRMKTGVKKDGTLTAISMRILENTGAYGTHALTVQCVSGSRALSLYRFPNIHFEADAVYTNLPVAGAFRGYGSPQGFFALDSHMDELAEKLGFDPLEFRRKNHVREGEPTPIAEVLGEGREGYKQIIQSCGLDECIELGAKEIGWKTHRNPDPRARIPGPTVSDSSNSGISGLKSEISNTESNLKSNMPNLKSEISNLKSGISGPVVRGVGMSCTMQASGIPGVDMGAAWIKMNEDGSFNLKVGATDIGTGADTMFAQVAAETLGTSPEKIIVYSSDTDMTPFDPGAYASSTTYISGAAVKKACDQVREQILEVAAEMLNPKKGIATHPSSERSQAGAARTEKKDLVVHDGKVCAPDGRFVTFEQICLRSLYQENQFQIQGHASHMSYDSPPPFCAQFAEVDVDVETGIVKVRRLVTAVDCGVAINPKMAEGQIEGAVTQALGYALTEQMVFDEKGRPLNLSFRDYNIYTAVDMPELKSFLVETYEPTGPYGAKAIAEIPINGVAPAIANAVYNAVGVRIRDLPITPEKVLKGLTSLPSGALG
ncbi:MAG: xanthine dehydrogenase family protein molybdopterin-binding subunit [Terriglobia bacterium]